MIAASVVKGLNIGLNMLKLQPKYVEAFFNPKIQLSQNFLSFFVLMLIAF